jgi:hypothetical protein
MGHPMVETIQKSTNIFRVMQAKGLQGGKEERNDGKVE